MIRDSVKLTFRSLLALVVCLAGTVAFAQDPEVGAYLPAQAAADVIREKAGTDGAFLAAALVKETFNKEKDDLAGLLKYPTDQIVVMNLTGAQIRQAFERSLSFHPQPNTSFLQISGFEVTFNKNGQPNSRVISVTAGGSKLEDGTTYTVAMPASLGRGGLGYFKIWEKVHIARTLELTVEDALKGSRYSETSPRWQPQG